MSFRSPSTLLSRGISNSTAIITPMAFAITSHNKLCQAALANTWGGLSEAVSLSREDRFMNGSIVHFQKLVAAQRQTAIVRGHQQRHSFGCREVQKQIEYRAARLFVQ